MLNTLGRLRPIESDLVPTLERATAQRGETRRIAAAASRRDIRRIYFVGMGGSWASSVPVTAQLQASALPVPVFNVNAAEFTALMMDRVDEHALVIAASHSGGTPETVEAAAQAKAKGALVVSVAI